MAQAGRLTGKVTVLIGAAGLLGRAFARRILREGGSAILADFNLTACEALARQLTTDYPESRARSHFVDTSDAASIGDLILHAKALSGRIDAVVNAAYARGPGYGARFEDVTLPNFC